MLLNNHYWENNHYWDGSQDDFDLFNSRQSIISNLGMRMQLSCPIIEKIWGNSNGVVV